MKYQRDAKVSDNKGHVPTEDEMSCVTDPYLAEGLFMVRLKNYLHMSRPPFVKTCTDKRDQVKEGSLRPLIRIVPSKSGSSSSQAGESYPEPWQHTPPQLYNYAFIPPPQKKTYYIKHSRHAGALMTLV